MNHLLSETALWITKSEFVYPDGSVSNGKGESNVVVKGDTIINNSWILFGETKLTNNYIITLISDNEYQFESLNPELGIQKGVFNIDRNFIFSKFEIPDTSLNGFEIIKREADICYANGALYDGIKLINTWYAVMEKSNIID